LFQEVSGEDLKVYIADDRQFLFLRETDRGIVFQSDFAEQEGGDKDATKESNDDKRNWIPLHSNRSDSVKDP